ncbi:MAG TPA: HAMP domain-containing sensor histidine kinase, partial [Candidatus Eisenbacteria bacterium]|nr:HAMP domain-containing sensor histidine kinase [Candidatus Eisenbacteria bacterium]
MQPTTEIVCGSDKVVDRFVQFMYKAQRRIDVCVHNTRPSLATEFNQIRDTFIDAKRRAVTIRYITEITKDNLGYCNELRSIVDELRHLDAVKGNFYVTEEEYVAPSTFHEEGKFSEWMVYSNFKEIVEHQHYVFDSFWNTSSSSDRRTTEIRNNVSLGVTENIDNPSRTQELFIDLIKSAKSEVLLMLPTVNSFMREYRIGVIQLLEELSTHPIGRAVNIRILTPINTTIKKILEQMKTKIILSEETFPSDNYYTSNLKICRLESKPNLNVTTATILVVDRKASLAIEKINDLSERFIDAVGLSSYSTSQPTVISYLSIFENFWGQLELYQKLKQHDKMQQEFINIAAHELRTPAQSILGYAELALNDPQYIDKQSQSFIGAMYRNAFRIQKLTQDILDVTRIESHTFRLKKIKFDLNEIILNVIEDMKLKLVSEGHNRVKIEFKNRVKAGEVVSRSEGIFVQADRDRITQVIYNLLDNALKFTSDGVVSIDLAIEKEYKERKGEEELLVVSIQDTGSGIDPEIFPRLFTKFSSKSYSGTGLGLYISKSIIEAHGDKVWAQ